MNLLNHDVKMKLFTDNSMRPPSKWSHHMGDMVRKTNKNLNTGIYMMPNSNGYSDIPSVASSSKRLMLDEMSYCHPTNATLQSRTSQALNNTASLYKAGNSNGFSNI